MSLAVARRRCLTQIKALDLPTPTSVADVRDRVAALTGRPIRILRHKLPSDSPCGLRIATLDTDYLVVQESASPAHQDLILLHELGHVLFDPEESLPLDEDLLKALVPQVDPATVTCMLGRSRYALESEQAAEVFATLLFTRTNRWVPRSSRVVAPGADDIVGRIEGALESRRG
jgi:IrrE N-terminal-like domain